MYRLPPVLWPTPTPRPSGRKPKPKHAPYYVLPNKSSTVWTNPSDVACTSGEPIMLLMLDNYDSFTWNLVQYFGGLGENVVVHRNDQITITDIEAMQPDRICLSPGPGTPDTAGITLDVIRHFSGRIPIFGVCLGHQAIACAFGGHVQDRKS